MPVTQSVELAASTLSEGAASPWSLGKAGLAAAILFVSLVALMQIAVYGHFTYDLRMYYNLARHFLEGRYDLAVSGYWSPLFIALLAVISAGVSDLFLIPCIVMALSAVVFAGGSLMAIRRFGSPMTLKWGIWPIMAFGVLMSGAFSTPDLMAAGLFAWAAARTADIKPQEKTASLLATGALLGLCYLAKMVLLGAGLAALFILLGLKARIGELTPRRAARAFCIVLFGAAAVAGPWIAVLSSKYGAFTVSTTPKKMWLVTALEPGEMWTMADTFARQFVVPEPGRQSPFEDESVFIKKTWSPLNDGAAARHYLKRVLYSVNSTLRALALFDIVGMGMVGALLGFALAAPWRTIIRTQRWRWTLLVILSAVLPYVAMGLLFDPIAITGRYLFTVFPFIVIADLEFACSFTRKEKLNKQTMLVLCGLTAALIAGPLAVFWKTHALSSNEPSKIAFDLVRRLERLDHLGPLACVGAAGTSCEADDAAFLLRLPYHGNGPVRTEEDARASRALLLVTARGGEMDHRMRGFAGLENVDRTLFASDAEAAAYPLVVYRNRAVAGSVEGHPSRQAR